MEYIPNRNERNEIIYSLWILQSKKDKKKCNIIQINNSKDKKDESITKDYNYIKNIFIINI